MSRGQTITFYERDFDKDGRVSLEKTGDGSENNGDVIRKLFNLLN
jgi:hypothetical protein